MREYFKLQYQLLNRKMDEVGFTSFTQLRFIIIFTLTTK